MVTQRPITCADEFPATFAELRPYANKIRPRGGKSTLWVVIRLACENPMSDLLSQLDSPLSWYYSDIHGGAYPYEVQTSEDAVEVGALAYTSNNISEASVLEWFKPFLRLRDPLTGELRDANIGAVAKMHKDFPKSEQNWDLPTERPIIIYADRKDAKQVRSVLYTVLNRQPDFMLRPGSLNTRLIPAKDFLSVSSSAGRNRGFFITKHGQVVLSLRLLRTTDIKALDKEVTINGQKYTLRKELLQIRYPLGSPETVTERFFFTVDWAERGRNLVAGECYLTAYSDRLSIASTFVRILPVYITAILGQEVTKQWFQPSAIAECQGVSLTTDKQGLWTGGWSTEDDDFDLDILQEDMGGGMQFDYSAEALASRNEPDQPAHATADDATAYTFGDQVFGRNSAGQQTATQSEADQPASRGGEVAPTESAVAAAPSEDPPTGGRPAGRGGVAD